MTDHGNVFLKEFHKLIFDLMIFQMKERISKISVFLGYLLLPLRHKRAYKLRFLSDS